MRAKFTVEFVDTARKLLERPLLIDSSNVEYCRNTIPVSSRKVI